MTMDQVKNQGSDMSNKENDLLRMATAGDQAATETILMNYKGLVRRKAASMYMAGADHEDVIQEGMIGLYQAIRDYRPDHQVPFVAFAAYCVTARITDAVRRASRLKHQPLNESLSLYALPQNETSLKLLDLFADTSRPDPESALLERERLHDLQYFIHHELSDLERKVVLAFLETPDYPAIATQLKGSVKMVDNALRRARDKFRQFRSQQRQMPMQQRGGSDE